jgi:hypothetical protein
MATTANGWTYALSTDPLIDWPAQSLAVATKLQARLPHTTGSALPFAVRSGNTLAVAANSGATVTFPSGRFTVAPQLLVSFDTISTTLSGPCGGRTTSATAGNVYNSSSAARDIWWLAIQMTPTAQLG